MCNSFQQHPTTHPAAALTTAQQRALASFKAHATMTANKLADATDPAQVAALIEKLAAIEHRALVFITTH